ncbi:hypothetical protein CHS0354_030431 [Potamilus streckersoni]|uniref:G-protein coupled receptors family 1 profile domain-containing protein n=1 Tax=Potamilus streckersoni TaxID=2493646 RepID=A0AAE0S8L4_9BIVA|nr:hypothetical protein CHS0354_030431 [Potamilus streckersoni]
MCVITGFTAFTFIMSDINTLALIAFSRYVVVCKPEWDYLLKEKYPKYFLIGIWTYTLIWTVIPLFGLSNYTYEPFGTSCTLHWHGRQIVNIIYNSLCLVCCYVVHIVTFVFCYSQIIRNYWKMNRATDTALPLRPQALGTGQNMAVEEIIGYHKIVSTSHLTKVSLTMVVLFLIAWTPYAVITVWNIFSTPVNANIQILPTMFAKISCATNPIIHGFLSYSFRQTTRRLLLKKPNENRHLSERKYQGTTWIRSFNGPMTVNGIYIGTHCIHVSETEEETRY